MKQLTILALFLMVSGCATLNREECLAANWRVIGYEDGAQGYSTARIGEHREACAEYGVVPDLPAYQAGHGQGVLRYCTAMNGYEAGRSGDAYQGVCPGDLENEFLNGYEAGKRIYQATTRLRSLESELQSIERELQGIDHTIEEREAKLFGAGISADQHRQYYREISSLKERRGRLLERSLDVSSQKVQAELWLRRLEEGGPY